MITTCTKCGSLYEAGSEEQAYESVRLCFSCRPNCAVQKRSDADSAQLRVGIGQEGME